VGKAENESTLSPLSLALPGRPKFASHLGLNRCLR
jgi:hypothetical protein